jgi:hypothetical protein
LIALVAVGIVGSIAFMVVGQLFEAVVPSLGNEYKNSIFRPWSDPVMSLIFVYPFAIGFFAAILYEKVKDAFEEDPPFRKGFHYGGLLWLVIGIPALFINYSTFNLSAVMILSWTFSSLVVMLVSGVLIAWIYEKWK